ncbi:MAG: hypothetical protein ABFQ95_05880 [Pseudomonadota bacterium]
MKKILMFFALLAAVAPFMRDVQAKTRAGVEAETTSRSLIRLLPRIHNIKSVQQLMEVVVSTGSFNTLDAYIVDCNEASENYKNGSKLSNSDFYKKISDSYQVLGTQLSELRKTLCAAPDVEQPAPAECKVMTEGLLDIQETLDKITISHQNGFTLSKSVSDIDSSEFDKLSKQLIDLKDTLFMPPKIETKNSVDLGMFDLGMGDKIQQVLG